MYLANQSKGSKAFVGSEVFGSTQKPWGYFNLCDHLRVRAVNLPFGGVLRENGLSRAHRVYYMRQSLPTTLIQLAMLKAHPILDYTEAQRTAWHSMQEEFAGNVSLINFIYELKDFRSIIKASGKLPFKPLGNGLRRFLGKLSSKPGFNSAWLLSKPLAEVHLANEFAIKPLIKDIMAIGQELSVMVREAQEEFGLAGNTVNTRHYSEIMHQSSSFTTVSNKYYSSGSYEATEFNATLRYKYQYVKRDTIDALTHFWGLNLTGEAVWNMIPFSFLLDYIVGVGKAISIMEHDPNVHTVIHEYCESLLSRVSEGLHLVIADHPSPVIIDHSFVTGTRLISGTESTLYTRYAAAPNQGAVLPRIRVPSNKQALNATALLRVFL